MVEKIGTTKTALAKYADESARSTGRKSFRIALRFFWSILKRIRNECTYKWCIDMGIFFGFLLFKLRIPLTDPHILLNERFVWNKWVTINAEKSFEIGWFFGFFLSLSLFPWHSIGFLWVFSYFWYPNSYLYETNQWLEHWNPYRSMPSHSQRDRMHTHAHACIVHAHIYSKCLANRSVFSWLGFSRIYIHTYVGWCSARAPKINWSCLEAIEKGKSFMENRRETDGTKDRKKHTHIHPYVYL